MKGIDLSAYQTNINYAQQKASGVEIVYIKATEGLTFNNDLMMAQYNSARACGLKIGFYHYLRANDPVLEAKHFLSRINGLHADCKYAIDAEVLPVGISARVRAFANYLISQGKEPCLYTGLSFYNSEILSIVRDLPLWIAKYGGSRPNIKSIGWQYSESPIDQDIFDAGILLPTVKPIATVVTPPIRQFPIIMTANIENIGVTTTKGNNLCSIGTIGKSLRLEAFSMTIGDIGFNYSIHEQSVGDSPVQTEGNVLGSVGVCRRIEGITITVTSIPVGFKLQYRGNIQNLGMSQWMDSNSYLGTKDKSLRLENVEVKIIAC